MAGRSAWLASLLAASIFLCTVFGADAQAQGLQLKLGDSTISAPADGRMLIVDGTPIASGRSLPLSRESLGDITVFNPPLSEDLFGSHARLGAILIFTTKNTSPHSAPGCAESEPLFEFQVDQPAGYTPLQFPLVQPHDNVPEQNSQNTTTVLAQFVVDTMGRVDARSFKILRAPSDEAAFTARRASSAWHYTSAMKGGCRVRQLVHATVK